MRQLLRIAGLTILTGFIIAFAWACTTSNQGDDDEEPSRQNGAGQSAPPVVAVDGGAGLVFTWTDEEGEHHVATERDDIPEGRRKMVRVQDPTQPPGDPSVVWVADLSEPKNGRYAVRSMKRAHYDRRLRPPPTKTPTGPSPDDAPSAREPAEATTVVMYSTSTCPVCRQARSWMAKQGYSFVERNIENDGAAARELQEKAARQGVSANGVPVFEIKGKLIPGFNRQAIVNAIGR